MSVERIYGVPLIVRSCRETSSVLSAHGIRLQGLLFLCKSFISVSQHTLACNHRRITKTGSPLSPLAQRATQAFRVKGQSVQARTKTGVAQARVF